MNFQVPLMLLQAVTPEEVVVVETQETGFDFSAFMVTVQENAISWLINLFIAIVIYLVGKMIVKLLEL